MSVEIALELDSEATLGTDQQGILIRGRAAARHFVNRAAVGHPLHLVQGIRLILHQPLVVQPGTDPAN